MDDSIAVEQALTKKDGMKRRLIDGDKKKFQKYINSTRAIKYIFNGKSMIRRTFWALLLFGLLIGCLTNIISSIIAYVQIPTSTTVYTDHVNELTFPAVTVCNLNGFNASYLEENNLTDLIAAAVHTGGDREGDYNKNCTSYDYPKDETLLNTILKSSQSIEDFVVDCQFLGKPCDINSMFRGYTTPNGICFTFNGRNDNENYLTTTGAGFRNDLQLVLNIQQETFRGSVYSEVGALVSVHKQDTPALAWESGIPVPLGHSAYLAVTHRQIEDRTSRSKEAELECIHTENARELKLINTYPYSFRACRRDCITQDLVNKCQCVWINSNSSVNRTCDISDICCIYDVLKHTTNNCGCSVLCNHTEYEVVPSYSTFPSTVAVADIAAKYNVSRETVLDNYLKVHVFFQSLSISREITERSYSLTGLIANIGGNMGLFLGASIISLMEFVIMILDQIKDRLFGVKEKKLRSSIDRFLVKKLKIAQSYDKAVQEAEKEAPTENGFVNTTYDVFKDKEDN